MPTYQYACTSCSHRFDAVQSFSDAALTECPECGARLRKLYGSVGVVFKGSGFYRTDSRNGSDKSGSSLPAAAKSDGGKSDGGKSQSGKSESKSSAGSNGASSGTPAAAATAKAS